MRTNTVVNKFLSNATRTSIYGTTSTGRAGENTPVQVIDVAKLHTTIIRINSSALFPHLLPRFFLEPFPVCCFFPLRLGALFREARFSYRVGPVVQSQCFQEGFLWACRQLEKSGEPDSRNPLLVRHAVEIKRNSDKQANTNTH